MHYEEKMWREMNAKRSTVQESTDKEEKETNFEIWIKCQRLRHQVFPGGHPSKY